MPIRVEIDGHAPMEFEDGTSQSIIDQVVGRTVGGPSFADKNKANIARISSGQDLPSGYDQASMPQPGESRLKSFAREAGLATNDAEGRANLGRIGGAALRTGAGIVGATVKAGLGAIAPPTALGRQVLGDGYVNPLEESVRGAVDAQVGNVKRGVAEIRRGDTLRGVGHVAAGALPMVGPAAAAVGDRLGTPETSEAIGEGLASLAAPKVINTTARAIGKTGVLAAKAGPAARTGLTETLPTKIGNHMVGSRKKDFAFGSNPGAAVRRLVVNSESEFPLKLREEVIPSIGGHLETVLKTPAAQTKYLPLRKMFEDGFREQVLRAKRNRDVPLLNALAERFEGRLAAAIEQAGGVVKHDANGRVIVPKHLEKITPDVSNRIKQSIGEDTKWSGETIGKTVNDAMVGTYRRFKAEINTAVPSAKVLNEQMANALTALKAIETKLQYGEIAHPFLNTIKNTARIGGVGAAILAGEPLTAAAILASPALGTAPVLSRVAAGLSKFARAEKPLPPTNPTLALPAMQMPIAKQPNMYMKRLPPAPETRALPPSQNVPLPGELQRDFFDRIGRQGQHLGTTPPMSPAILGAYRRYLLEQSRNGQR